MTLVGSEVVKETLQRIGVDRGKTIGNEPKVKKKCKDNHNYLARPRGHREANDGQVFHPLSDP